MAVLISPSVYAIAAAIALGGRSVAAAVDEMFRAGVRWVQVRAKNAADRDLYGEVVECGAVAKAYPGGSLWVNDRSDLAALSSAYGVHLGQHDLPPSAARASVGSSIWVGQSAHTEREVASAAADTVAVLGAACREPIEESCKRLLGAAEGHR